MLGTKFRTWSIVGKPYTTEPNHRPLLGNSDASQRLSTPSERIWMLCFAQIDQSQVNLHFNTGDRREVSSWGKVSWPLRSDWCLSLKAVGTSDKAGCPLTRNNCTHYTKAIVVKMAKRAGPNHTTQARGRRLSVYCVTNQHFLLLLWTNTSLWYERLLPNVQVGIWATNWRGREYVALFCFPPRRFNFSFNTPCQPDGLLLSENTV